MKLTKVVAFVSVFFVAIVLSLLSLVAINGSTGSVEGILAERIILSTLQMRLYNFSSIFNGQIVVTDITTPTVIATVAEIKTDIEGIEPAAGEVRRDIVSVTADATKQSCKSGFPPKCDMYPYVQFWNKVLYKEDCYQSPLRHPLKGKAPPEEQKYVVFQPDGGGWNNIRMAAETVMIFAHATGRVLVMPPKAQWYLLGRNSEEKDNQSNFDKFFDLERIAEGLTIISMEDFLQQTAAKGLLKIPLPAEFQNVKRFSKFHGKLWAYLNEACTIRQWWPGKKFVGISLSSASQAPAGGNNSVDLLTGTVFNPIVPDAHTKIFASHDRTVMPYDKEFHAEKVIYFPGDYREEYRLLTHFYTYVHFVDEHVEHLYFRIVRDRLHYHDDIFCAAGRVVQLIHADAATLAGKAMKEGNKVLEVGRDIVQPLSRASKRTGGGDTNFDATYHAAHIRRGDFQYHETQLTAEQIYANIGGLFNRSVTKLLYISTDEHNMTFFEPFFKDFTVRFLGDYSGPALLGKSNQNIAGMVEQTICANAHTFVGTPLSTFTGYITRMRGYYRDGRYDRTFYTMPDLMHQLQRQKNIIGPFWAREFAVAHEDIDDIVR